jgi:hypothetical protein
MFPVGTWGPIWAIGERGCAAAIEQHPKIGAAVEPGVGALVPHVLHRCLELRQHEGAWAEEASQFKDAASRRPEEQIVIEEAGVDGIAEEEGIALHVAADINHWDAVRVEYARPWVDVVYLDLGLARDITVDDENVRLGSRLAQEGIDGKRRLARVVEGYAAVEEIKAAVAVLAHRRGNVRDAEHVTDATVLQRDQAFVHEALEIDEGARLDHLGIDGRKHGAALLVHEHVVPIAEIAGELGLEHAALLVDEGVAIFGEGDKASDAPRVVDLRRSALHAMAKLLPAEMSPELTIVVPVELMPVMPAKLPYTLPELVIRLVPRAPTAMA